MADEVVGRAEGGEETVGTPGLSDPRMEGNSEATKPKLNTGAGTGGQGHRRKKAGRKSKLDLSEGESAKRAGEGRDPGGGRRMGGDRGGGQSGR